MGRVRTFIAVDVGESIVAAATSLQKQLATSGAAVKWVEPDAMHITLLFLGEVDERDLVNVCRLVTKAAGEMPSFPLRIAGVGAFPNPRRPKVVWAGITDGAEELRRFFQMLEEPLIERGIYRKEERDFTPHLTLGRVRSEEDGNLLAVELPKHLAWKGGQTVIDEVLVMSSELRRDGPEYAVMGRSRLANSEV